MPTIVMSSDMRSPFLFQGAEVMRLRSVAVVLLALALATISAGSAAAQSTTTGRITGIITDQQGGVLPGATVTATSPQLQGARSTVSDSLGEYRILALPPGTYLVKAELSGFQPVERSNIQVSINSS